MIVGFVATQELGAIGLGDRDCTGRLETPDSCGIGTRQFVQEELAAARRGVPRHIEAVLHGHGNAVQEPGELTTHLRLLGQFGGLAGLVREDLDEGVHTGVYALDLEEVSLYEFHRRDSVGADLF